MVKPCRALARSHNVYMPNPRGILFQGTQGIPQLAVVCKPVKEKGLKRTKLVDFFEKFCFALA